MEYWEIVVLRELGVLDHHGALESQRPLFWEIIVLRAPGVLHGLRAPTVN